MNTLREQLNGLVYSAFNAEGWLRQQDMNYLPQQEAYAHSVVEWLVGSDDKPAGLLEGATGIGKSLGYLIPLFCWAALTGQRVAISTFTIHLQRQLLHNDIEIARRFLRNQNLVLNGVGHFLGRSNYLNPRRIKLLMEERAVESGPTSAEWIALLQWAAQTTIAVGDGTVQGYVESFGGLPDNLFERDICLHPGDPDEDSPAFVLARREAQSAQAVVTSHAVMVLNAIYRGRLLQGRSTDILPQVRAVVFDEADRLEAAAAFLQKRLQVKQLRRTAENFLENSEVAAHKLLQSASVRLIGALDTLHRYLSKLSAATNPLPMDQLDADAKAQIQQVANRIQRLLNLWDDGTPPIGSAQMDLEELRRAGIWLNDYLSASDEAGQYRGVAWSPVHRQPSLYEYRVDPQAVLNRDLQFNCAFGLPPVRRLFTSATLADAGKSYALRYKNFWAGLRIPRRAVEVEASFEPIKFGDLQLVLAAPHIDAPFASDDGLEPALCSTWLRYCAAMITRAATFGPTLVLTGSYDETLKLAALLRISHVCHMRGEKLGTVIAAFQSERSVLLTPGAWEGVSLRHRDGRQLFRELVITRLPFTQTSIEELAALRVLAKSWRSAPSAESIAFARRTNEAKRKLQQGIGRAIRAASDSCRVWIADPRFPHPDAISKFSSLVSAIPARFHHRYREAEFLTTDGKLRACIEALPVDAERLAMAYL